MNSNSALVAHLAVSKDDPCPIVKHNLESGINGSIVRELHMNPNLQCPAGTIEDGNTLRGRWNLLWHLLFPDDSVITSPGKAPYYTRHITD